MGEFELIEWIRTRTKSSSQVRIGIGDDCAALQVSPGAEVLVTTDMLMDGRHFRLGEVEPDQVGYKALGVNLSDIAAMAGIPIAAFVSVALPKAQATSIGQGLHEGMTLLADRFGVVLAGGDTNAWDGPLVVSVTLLGEVEQGRAIRRSGARAGDAIFVTGPLGGSLLGRHLRPEPRLELARLMAGAADIHAMIDISDGLASDLGHILVESGSLGAIVHADAIPIHEDARRAADLDGRSPLNHALRDGEDFELAFCADEQKAPLILRLDPQIRRIGTVTNAADLRLVGADGIPHVCDQRGFDHLVD
jgi:thiamine-monophosphate kinase